MGPLGSSANVMVTSLGCASTGPPCEGMSGGTACLPGTNPPPPLPPPPALLLLLLLVTPVPPAPGVPDELALTPCPPPLPWLEVASAGPFPSHAIVSRSTRPNELARCAMDPQYTLRSCDPETCSATLSR